MSEKDLLSLRLQVEGLLSSHSRLAAENNELHKKLSETTKQHASLLNKKEEACRKLKAILTQIKNGAL